MRLSWEASLASRAASANGVSSTATASSATQKPASSVVNRSRRSSSSEGHASMSAERSIAVGFHCRRATIWEKKDDFNAKLKKLGEDAKEAEAKVTDEATFKAVFPNVQKNCGGCHETYRLKKS